MVNNNEVSWMESENREPFTAKQHAKHAKHA